MRFILISDPGERETDRLLEAGCAARGIAFTRIVPGTAAGRDIGGPGTRRLIYCTGVSLAAAVAERLLHRPGDAILHDPWFACTHAALMLRRAGLPMARAVYVPDRDPVALSRQVEALGGYPVVVKVPGFEGGKGISLAHDLAALQAALAGAAHSPMLELFVPHDLCWRVTVLGERALAATARRAGDGDFRSNAPGSIPVPGADPPPGLEAIALAAARALRLTFGGADIMQAADGGLTLAEFNFPCYFADQQAETGTDIAGAIIDHLARMPAGAPG